MDKIDGWMERMRSLAARMRAIPKILALGVLGFGFYGCGLNSNGTVVLDPPHCQVVSQSAFKPAGLGTFSTITFVVQNTGGEASSVEILVKLKKGSLIVDEETQVLTSLQGGESIQKDIWFPNVQSAQDFDAVVVTLSWWDTDGGYYTTN